MGGREDEPTAMYLARMYRPLSLHAEDGLTAYSEHMQEVSESRDGHAGRNKPNRDNSRSETTEATSRQNTIPFAPLARTQIEDIGAQI